ncbi:MAG: S-layer homology domain-containing protein [Desulfotomaculaceae bacterium]|nr:S-layer homology domain-containing protein [Desulfotomaculaceae bacterium]
MLRKVQMVFLIAALAAVMVFGRALSSEAGVVKLLDIEEASWAEQEITEMGSLEILQGYPDGKFMPYQSVTRLEAVAMLIRIVGLDGQARALENANVDYKIPSNLPWGRGYLIMAVQQGMLDKNYLNELEPTGAATRAQVAALVCLALDLGLTTTDSSLVFADAAQIPSGYQGYVATLVDKKLMQGLPGNVFEPNSVINRAQMAVLLSNLLNGNFANPYPTRLTSGTISNIEPISGLIALQGGTSKFLSAECQYYLDGIKVASADIKIGDAVKLVSDDNGQVIFVRAVKSKQVQQVYIYVSGEIRSLENNEITLKNVNGYRSIYTLDDAVKVVIDGSSKKLTDLDEEDQVRLKLDSRNYVLSIEVLDSSESDLEGEIYNLDTSGTYGITIRNDDGEKYTYKVVDDVDVYDGNSDLDFDELETGDEVMLELDSDGWVDEIELLDSSDSELEGKIYNLDTSGTYGITIRNDDGEKYTYKVVDDVDVYDGNSDLDFDELETGDEVRLELDDDGWADEIEFLDSDQSTEEGIISGLKNGSSPRLWLTNSDDDEERYDISDDIECTRDGDSIDLEDIVIGSEAEIEIEDDEVVTIEIIDDEDITIEGEIVDVRVSSERIKIEQDSGNQFTYYLKSGASLKDSDGDSIDLEDVEEGWDVELRLSSGKIYRLTEQ